MDKNLILFTEERKSKILELIKKQKKVTVAELCDTFNVSSATIRNDLRDLQQAGALTRTHGGAIEKIQTGFEPYTKDREVQHLKEKQGIAASALELIQNGDQIILDAGTTTRELAKLLHHKNNLTILTNDIIIARILEEFDSVEIFLFSGFIRKQYHCTSIISNKEMYLGITADKAFMGASGFSLKKGATTSHMSLAETKKLMISMANKIVLLCDSTKMEKVSFVQFASVNDIDTLITDHMSPTDKEIFEDMGVEVISAK